MTRFSRTASVIQGMRVRNMTGSAGGSYQRELIRSGGQPLIPGEKGSFGKSEWGFPAKPREMCTLRCGRHAAGN